MSATTPATAKLPPTVEWRDGALYLLDQTRLPHDVVIERQETVTQVRDSIYSLKVRGAPAIGVAAAYGLCVAMESHRDAEAAGFIAEVLRQADFLEAARPTAVNLRWSLQRMIARAKRDEDVAGAALYDALIDEAQRIHAEDRALCRGIGTAGLALIKEGANVLTHCNAGALATTGIGTATAPLYVAQEAGIGFQVFADETRPLLQGARLTAWELGEAGVDVTLITDSMAASLMQAGEIDLVVTGADRVAANGDVANKIGTLGVAILANHFGIPFYAAVPSSTIDLDCPSGADIPIEERANDEVTGFAGTRTAPAGTHARNPAFDATPNALVAGLITERGIVRPPFADNLKTLFGSTEES